MMLCRLAGDKLTVRRIAHEAIREPMHRDPHVCLHSVLPAVINTETIAAVDVHIGDSAFVSQSPNHPGKARNQPS